MWKCLLIIFVGMFWAHNRWQAQPLPLIMFYIEWHVTLKRLHTMPMLQDIEKNIENVFVKIIFCNICVCILYFSFIVFLDNVRLLDCERRVFCSRSEHHHEYEMVLTWKSIRMENNVKQHWYKIKPGCFRWMYTHVWWNMVLCAFSGLTWHTHQIVDWDYEIWGCL